MSLIIRNQSGAQLSIDDIGITLAIGATYDLAIEPAAIVAVSSELQTLIGSGNIDVLDPLDNLTPLSIADAQEAVAAMNDPHYGIRRGLLDQIDDVNVGSPGAPEDGFSLAWDNNLGEYNLQSPSVAGTPRQQIYHVGKHGNDANNGLTPDNAKLTFTNAIATAVAQTPSSSNRFTIYCEDSGIYAESFTISAFLSVEAVDATIQGTVTVSDNSEVTVREIEAAVNTSAVIKTAGTASARVTSEILRGTGTGDTVTTQGGETGVLLINSRQVFTEDGSAIHDVSTAPSGHIHVEIEDLYVTGTGSGLDRNSSTGLIVGRIVHLLEIGGGVGNGTGIAVSTGRVDVLVAFLDTTTAWNVSAGGTLKLLSNEITGAKTQTSGTAVVDVIEANILRWVTETGTFTPRRTGYVAIDTFAATATMNLPTPPSDGDNISFRDARNTFETNALTVDAGAGNLIDDGGAGTQTVVLDVSGTSGIFIYSSSIARWTFTRIQEEVAFSPANLIYVTKNGDDVIGDGSFSNPFLTVKRGITEALSRVSVSPIPTTVKVLDGIYDEINPLIVSGVGSEFVQIQGEQENAIIVRPTVDTANLFELTSNVTGSGPTLNRMTLNAANLATFKTNNQAAVLITGPGRFVVDKVNIDSAGVGLDVGNGVSTDQEAVYDFATISNCNTGLDAKGDGVVPCQVAFFRNNGIGLAASGNVRVEIGNYAFQGADFGDPVAGQAMDIGGAAQIVATSGTISNHVIGIEVAGTSNSQLLTTIFVNNTTEFDQQAAAAVLRVQGALSKTKQLITDGTNVSLNYIDSDTGDFIVGNADATGDPGLEFRVRDADGRVFIGDNATNANAPTNTVGGSRTINLIDTNGNLRIWRWQGDPGLHPAFEWLKGINTFAADDEGDAPITTITGGANGVITIDLSGADYNDPLDPGFKGADRTTLDTRVFFPGAEIRVNGSPSDDGDYVVQSSTYNSGPQTIDVTMTTAMTGGGTGTAVFGGGAGRPDGVSTYVGDPSAAIVAGVGDVHWDMLLRETDHFVIRRRTGGPGKEHVRIFRDRTEFQHGTDYDGGNNNLVLLVNGVTGSTVNYLEINNSITANGPEIVASGADTNIDIEMIPAGTGTVIVPPGYEANIIDDSLITKAYIDNILLDGAVVQARRTTTFAIPLTWTDLDFDTTDIETDSSVIEHLNPGTADTIQVKEDGLYEITYHLSADDEIQGRLFVNGTTVIPGSTQSSGDPGDVNDVITPLHVKVYENLTASDNVVVQIQAATTAETLQVDSMFQIKKATGIKGDTGPPGAGSSLTFEDEGIAVPNGPHDTLDVVGQRVAVTDGGGGTATLTVTPRSYLFRHNAATTQTYTAATTINFGTDVRTDSDYTHALVVGGSEITINRAGWYKISYDITANGTTGTRSDAQHFIENNTVLVPGSVSHSYHRTVTPGEQTASATVLVNAALNDVIRVRSLVSTGTAIVTVANGCRLNIESVDNP